jgi:hypothetical protein
VYLYLEYSSQQDRPHSNGQVNGVIFSSYGSLMNMIHPGQTDPTLGKICMAGMGSGMVGA